MKESIAVLDEFLPDSSKSWDQEICSPSASLLEGDAYNILYKGCNKAAMF